MNTEIEKEIREEIEKLMGYLFYRIREISGEFPTKMRVTNVFGTFNHQMHFMETEKIVTQEQKEIYEESYQEYIKRETIEQAKKIIKDD